MTAPRRRRYLVERMSCPLGRCKSAFITKSGFLAHMRRVHKFTEEQLTWPKMFLRERFR